jgi:hypothetical protein
LKLDDRHTTTVLINHELQTHRRLELSLNALAATDLHVRPSLADRFCFPRSRAPRTNLKNHKRHVVAMTFVQRFLRTMRLAIVRDMQRGDLMRTKRLNLRG